MDKPFDYYAETRTNGCYDKVEKNEKLKTHFVRSSIDRVYESCLHFPPSCCVGQHALKRALSNILKFLEVAGCCKKGVFYAINLKNACLKSMVNFFKLKFVCKGLFGRQRNCLVVWGVQNPAKFTVISSWKFSCYF